jgi:molybdopterin molybdotransferase
MTELLNVDVALERILSKIHPLAKENVALEQSLGRTLANDIFAAVSLPPFDNSSMDGYAVYAEDVSEASRQNRVQLDVVMDILAGVTPTQSLLRGQAARIMTGAPLPEGANAVIPVEDTDGAWDKESVAGSAKTVGVFRPVNSGAYVRPIGEEITAGDLMLTAGTLIQPPQIGVLAAMGHAEVKVSRCPRVVILSSGDELVGVDEALVPGKIRNTNSYSLAALVQDIGGEAIRLPTAPDSLDAIRELFEAAIDLAPDMIISSAGVSVGAADYVYATLMQLGEVDFWRINIRPGKPLAFGMLQGIPFFGLPGNPVSTMVTFDVLVRPALYKQLERRDDTPYILATVAEDMTSDGRRSYVRVKLEYRDNRIVAYSTGTQSSGALMSMALADGLLIVPEGMTDIKAGSQLSVRVFRMPQIVGLH